MEALAGQFRQHGSVRLCGAAHHVNGGEEEGDDDAR